MVVKIVLVSIGTRGDMEPLLAIGEILREKGERVICAFPEQFRDLAEDANMEFASLGTRFVELLDSDVGKAALGGSGAGFKKFLATMKLAQVQTKANKEMIHKQYEIIEREKPDRIVYNSKAVYPPIWGLKNKGKATLVCAAPYMHYVKDHTHLAFNNNFGPFFNKWTYALADFGLVVTTSISANWLNLTEKPTRKQIKNALSSNKAIYMVSPSLFSRPDYWKENLKVLGFHERNKRTNWQPDKALNDFLEKHKNNRILLVTFGSMLNPEPEEKTKIITGILEQNKIPAIINTGAGGLVKPKNFDSELLHFVSQIPYDWIFPKIHGVIHHGGSGTTHTALKYGCATIIVPHIIDQYAWDKIISTIGVGPKGVKIDKITVDNLEPKILELVNNDSYKKKAKQVANQIEKESFREEIYNAIMG